MKKVFLFKVCLIAGLYCYCQNIARLRSIDSIIMTNERNIKATYQSEKKGVVETMHDRHPIKDDVYVLKYTKEKIPVEIIEIKKFDKDTDIVVHNYFDGKKVIKIHCIWNWTYYNTDRSYYYEDIIYIDNGKIISAVSTNEENQPYKAETYLLRANDLLKRVKRNSLKFPI